MVGMGLSGIVLVCCFMLLHPNGFWREHHHSPQAKQQRGKQDHPYQPELCYRLQGSWPTAQRYHFYTSVLEGCTRTEDF